MAAQGRGSGRRRSQGNAAQSETPEIDLSTLQALAAAATSTTPDPDEDSEQENNRKYILDSGSQPSHVNYPLLHMKPLTKPVKTLTATSISTDAPHTGHLKVTTDRDFCLQIPAIVHPNINPNLLSVHDTGKQWGLVPFSPKNAFMISAQAAKPQIVGTAKYIGAKTSCAPAPKSMDNSKH